LQAFLNGRVRPTIAVHARPANGKLILVSRRSGVDGAAAYGRARGGATLLAGGEAHGFIFYMRDSLTVYTLMISGIPMDVDIMWKQLLLPRLEMLSRIGS